MPALFLVVVDPYAVPQVSSSSLKKAIGFKTEVSYCDALMVLKYWITSKVPFRASMSQMCKFYTFLSEGVADSKIDIKREFMSSPSIFTPLQRPRASEVIPGRFLAPEDLYWHDPTGCSEITKILLQRKTEACSQEECCLQPIQTFVNFLLWHAVYQRLQQHQIMLRCCYGCQPLHCLHRQQTM